MCTILSYSGNPPGRNLMLSVLLKGHPLQDSSLLVTGPNMHLTII